MSKWSIVKLGKVLREERDRIGTFDADGLPVLGVTNTEGVTRTGAEASEDKSKYLRLRPGRFVYNPYRINVGSIGLSSDSQDGICSPAYTVFTVTDQIISRFLWFFLKSSRGNQLINFFGNRGSVRSALRFSDLCQIEIQLPPLAEQRRIVARIEELAAQINEAKELRRQSLEDANTFLSNAIDAVFTRLANIYQTCNFDSFSPHVTSGPRNWAKHYEQTGFRFYRAQDIGVNGDILNDSKAFIVPPSGVQGRTAELQYGDLMLVITGATVGRVSVFRQGMEPGFVSQHVAICRLPQDKIFPEFSLWGLRGVYGQNQLIRQRYGQGKPGLNLTNIRSLSLPVPPLSEQRRIVSELDVLQVKVADLSRLQEETATELNALLSAVLDRAFKREL